MSEYQITGKDWESIASGQRVEFKSPDGLEVKILNVDNVKEALSAQNSDKPLLIFVSGTSESGKSTFGKLAVQSGIAHRLKIYKTLAELSGAEGLPEMTGNPFDYATLLEVDSGKIEKAGHEIASRYVSLMQETDVPIAVVETIKHKWMAEQFRRNPDIRFLSVLIDADLEQRVAREAKKTGKPLDEVRAEVLRKDDWKQALGSEDVGSTADIYVLNNGDYETYEQMITSFLETLRGSTQTYSGKARDYSLD